MEGKTLEDWERESGIPLPPARAGRLADVMAEALERFVSHDWPLTAPVYPEE